MLYTDISKNNVTNSLMPRTPFQIWYIRGTRPNRRTTLGPVLPNGHVTGYGSMAGRLLMTLTAVLNSCLVIYIFWTPYKAPGWQTICRKQTITPPFTNTWNHFLPCQDKVLIVTTCRSGVYHHVSHIVTTCRSGVYHHVSHMKDSQNYSIGNR